MRSTILAVMTAFVIGGATTGALVAQAQPAPPAAQVAEPPPGPGPTGPHPHWMHGPGWGGMRHGGPGPGTFALVYRQADRQLTASDVQKIAEAFLLWQGNHTWKVVDVAPTSDGPIGFSIATPEGSVIAKFTMDPHTGRVTRTG
ncbi:MAG: hypothetical protein BGO51_02005 [Rhodospirillales bacterium 69-11]|nr:hypothetical protein [Rhodospirillales bacterium]MBN8927474.1 hypothetical protein [Rhodospirillales bacterium]OJW25373.1 MAG: hypothetical protein BGO51_02005 [Rhodospirillales bacterium 69-11]